jgi:hypothetical protein
MKNSNGLFGVSLGFSKLDTVYVVNKNDSERIRKAINIYQEEVGKQGVKTLERLASFVIANKGINIMDVVVGFSISELKRSDYKYKGYQK